MSSDEKGEEEKGEDGGVAEERKWKGDEGGGSEGEGELGGELGGKELEERGEDRGEEGQREKVGKRGERELNFLMIRVVREKLERES